MAIPLNVFSAILNVTERKYNRHDARKDAIPYVHVSSLINTSLYDSFCEREFVLRYLERSHAAGSAVPPKFQVLYETGHALGAEAVNKFIRRSAQYAKYAWGDWVCLCKRTRTYFGYMPDNMYCEHCRTKVDTYAETDLRNDSIRVVGHADFLMRDEDGTFIVYEIKSIDRTGVVFEDLTEPFGDHVLQASFYYWLLISLGYKVDKTMRIVYIDRSLSDIYTALPYKTLFAQRVARNRIDILGRKARRAYNGARTATLPKRLCESITDSRAKKCMRAVSCFERINDKTYRVPDVFAEPKRSKRIRRRSRRVYHGKRRVLRRDARKSG